MLCFGNVRQTLFSQGKIERVERFQSNFTTDRNIDIWLPIDYDTTKKYSVVYMHDGQMLFDSSSTWNGLSWNLDQIASRLNQDPRIKPFILVGIWNDPENRHADFFPKKPFDRLTAQEVDTLTSQLQIAGRTKKEFVPLSDSYLHFLIQELMPWVRRNYAISEKRKDTFLGGSSMGGLISIYAYLEYPKVFGGVFCMSTHWPGSFTLKNNPFPEAILSYLAQEIPILKKTKIYFDCGDQTLDALYPALQEEVDKLFLQKTRVKRRFVSKRFPGDEHSEKAWAKRVELPLRYLLSK